MRRRARCLAIAALIVATAACGDDDDDTDTSAPPVPSATAGPSTATSTEVTTQVSTTAPESTTTELNPVPTAPTAPPTTTSAPVELPPVSTLVPQVPAELLTPEQLDPFNVNNSRPILPEHVPVIEAAMRAGDAFAYVASQPPINPEAPELLAAPFTPEVLQGNQDSLQRRSERGEILNVAQGVTERPYIIGPVTDAAVLFDCFIDGVYWTTAEGQPIPPTAVYPAGPGSVVEVGIRVDMVQRNGQWLVGRSQIDDGACT